MTNKINTQLPSFEINENYVEEVDKLKDFMDTPTDDQKRKVTQISSNIFEQLTGSQIGPGRLIYNFILFVTYNISVVHFSLYSITRRFYLLPSVMLLLFHMALSYLFQRKIDSLITKIKSNSFCQYLEENFGKVSAILYEIIAVIWIGTFFLIVFIIKNDLIHSYYDIPVYLDVVLAFAFFVVIVLINLIDSKILMEINILLTFFLIIGSFVTLSIDVIDVINEGNYDISTEYIFWNSKIKAKEIFQFSNVLSSSFNMFIIFFFINHKLKHSNYSLGKHNTLFTIGYIVEMIFYFLFIAAGFVSPNKKANVSNFYLLNMWIERTPNISELISIIFFIVDQILHTNFYFFVLQNVIFRPAITRFFTKWNFFLLFALTLLISILLGFIVKYPYDVIEFTNATLGYFVNYAFPCLLLLRNKYTAFSIILILFVISIGIVNLSSFYELVLKSLFNDK